MIRILFLESSRDFGGQERRMLDIAAGLDPAGFRVSVGARPDSYLYREQQALGQQVQAFSMRNSLDLKGLWQILAYLRREGIRLLITYSGKDAWLGLLAGRLSGVPVVRMKNLELFKHRTSYNLSRRVVVPSAHIRDFLVGHGVRRDRIEILHPGVDTGRFRPDPDARAAVRARHGLAPDDPVLVYVAHFREPKKQLLLVQTLGLIADPRVTLLLVGDTQAPYYQRVLDEVARLGLGDRVICTGRRPQVEQYLNAADLFLFPSVQEAMPRAVMEALACGLYVIGANIPALREILQEPYLGTVFDGGKAETLAPVLARSIGALGTLARHKAQRHAFIRRHFDTRGMIRGFEAICRQAVEGPT